MKLTQLLAIPLMGLAMAASGDPAQQYIIERELPGAGALTTDELREISRKSRAVLEELGPEIRWVHSYVVDDKIYCVYEAPDAEIIRRHAEMGGFPANRISPVKSVIDPSTAD